MNSIKLNEQEIEKRVKNIIKNNLNGLTIKQAKEILKRTTNSLDDNHTVNADNLLSKG